MREPTRKELWHHEDMFGDTNHVDNVDISVIDENETGWDVQVDYDIMECDDIVDSATVAGTLWYDKTEDEFHLNVTGQVY
jgi:hypothetical protein